MLKTLLQPERAVKVVKSIAGHGFTFNEGEKWIIPAGTGQEAAILEKHSEPFCGSLHDATRFDPEEWKRSTRPRSAPPPMRELDEDGICKKFKWSREQWAAAKANGLRARKGAFGIGRNKWDEHIIDNWVAAIRSLNLR